MLQAVSGDFARCPGWTAVTILNVRHEGRKPAISKDVKINWAATAEQERSIFDSLASACEATFVIAPETGGRLLALRQAVEAAGGRFLGHTAEAIALCGDKLRLWEHLTSCGLPTIPTVTWGQFQRDRCIAFPVVVKPRDGAGSQDTYLVADARRFDEIASRIAYSGSDADAGMIVQPFVAGPSLSVAVLVNGQTGALDVFPTAEQRLSIDGRFRYQGSCIHASGHQEHVDVRELVAQACASIPGLNGYIGFDLIASEEGPVLVEANPRLTTSYLAYRALAGENLAQRMLRGRQSSGPIHWGDKQIELAFNSDHLGVARLG